jgi:hypothetical protein
MCAISITAKTDHGHHTPIYPVRSAIIKYLMPGLYQKLNGKPQKQLIMTKGTIDYHAQGSKPKELEGLEGYNKSNDVAKDDSSGFLKEIIDKIVELGDENTQIAEELQSILDRFTGEPQNNFHHLSYLMEDQTGYTAQLNTILTFLQDRNDTLNNLVSELKHCT